MHSEHPPSDENYSVNQISHCFILVSPMLFKWITYTALPTDKLRGWTNLQSHWFNLEEKEFETSNHCLSPVRCSHTVHYHRRKFPKNLIWDIGVAAYSLAILSVHFPLILWVFPTSRLSHQLAFSPSDQPVNRHHQKILKRKFVLTTNNQSIPDILVRGCP